MFNQPEIKNADLDMLRSTQTELLGRIRRWCSFNNIAFQTHYDTLSLSRSKMVQAWTCDLIPPYSDWQEINQKCEKQGTVLFVFTDSFINYVDLPYVKFYSDPTLCGIFDNYNNDIRANHSPSRLFNCFMQRIESARQSWFYHLHNRKLIDRGYVSFLLRQLDDYSTKTGVDLFDYIHHNYQLNNLSNFEQAYQEMRSKVPFRNFNETDALASLIEDSKYSLVLETYATDDNDDHWFVGEKAFRAMCYPSIPLLFMARGAVQKLKSIGLEINHHDEIDELPWIQRQLALLDILEHDAIAFDAKELYNTSRHNQEVLAGFRQRFQSTTYFDEFFEKIKNT